MKILASGFRGENLARHPLDLEPTVGTVSINQNPSRGDLRPWKAPVAVASVPAGRKTIYRMGRDLPSLSQYWLSWPTIVHAVRGQEVGDTTERTYYTGDGVPKWTDLTMGLAGVPYPTTFRLLGVPAPTQFPIITVISAGVSATTETRFYLYTYATDRGEESSRSPISLPVICKQDAVLSIGSLAPPPSGNYGINRIRIYRSETGTDAGTAYLFLREVPSTTTSTTDDNRQLQEPFVSATWLPPPANLRNLTGMWNGMMAGISGNEVRVCEINKPYAWPVLYSVVPSDATPVALGKFGQSLLILTTGKPVLVTGSTPDALDEQPLGIFEACVSVQSVVSFGHGVAWAGPNGLAYFGADGPKLVTGGLLDKEQWAAMNPSSIVGTMYGGAYMGFYTVNGVTKGFMIDPVQPTGMYPHDLTAVALFFDEVQGALFLLNGTAIQLWDAGAPLVCTFRTKKFFTPKPINLAAAKFLADGFPFTWRLYADNVLRHTQVVEDGSVFPCPGEYLAEQWQQEIVTSQPVQLGVAAESVDELVDKA